MEDILEEIPLGQKIPIKVFRNGREKELLMLVEERQEHL